MDSAAKRFRMIPLCAAICAVFGNPAFCQEGDAKQIVIPRMLSAQGAQNLTQGGQLTFITSNGVMQGSAASMVQGLMPQGGVVPTGHANLTAVFTSMVRGAQTGAVNLAVPTIAGVGAAMPAINGSAAPPGAALPVTVGGGIVLNGMPIASQVTNPAPSILNLGQAVVSLNSGGIINTTGSISFSGGLNVGARAAGGISSGVQTNSMILPTPVLPSGVISISSSGIGGAGAAVGLSGAKPITPVTVR